MRRALAIRAGRDEPADYDILLRLTDLLIKMNRFDEAEKIARGALDVLRTDDDKSEIVPMRLELLERLSMIHLAAGSKSRLEEQP
ncbi:MAG: tetratricopeptide repeat protein [Candidatus Xenobiia bacterium LiM19]